jgi:sulfur carrier protein ThiS
MADPTVHEAMSRAAARRLAVGTERRPPMTIPGLTAAVTRTEARFALAVENAMSCDSAWATRELRESELHMLSTREALRFAREKSELAEAVAAIPPGTTPF